MIEINKTNKDYNGVKWTLQAIGKDKMRPTLLYLNSYDNTVCCTDGMRAHYYTMQEISVPPGNYEVISTKDKVLLSPVNGINFPDMKNLIPKYSSMLYQYSETENNHQYNTNRLMAFLLRALPNSVCMEHKFIAEAIKGVDSYDISKNTETDCSPVLFQNTTHTALIQPMAI